MQLFACAGGTTKVYLTNTVQEQAASSAPHPHGQNCYLFSHHHVWWFKEITSSVRTKSQSHTPWFNNTSPTITSTYFICKFSFSYINLERKYRIHLTKDQSKFQALNKEKVTVTLVKHFGLLPLVPIKESLALQPGTEE